MYHGLAEHPLRKWGSSEAFISNWGCITQREHTSQMIFVTSIQDYRYTNYLANDIIVVDSATELLLKSSADNDLIDVRTEASTEVGAQYSWRLFTCPSARGL